MSAYRSKMDMPNVGPSPLRCGDLVGDVAEQVVAGVGALLVEPLDEGSGPGFGALLIGHFCFPMCSCVSGLYRLYSGGTGKRILLIWLIKSCFGANG